MKKTLQNECLAIFKAGVKAVDPYQAVNNFLRVEGDFLHLPNHTFKISAFKNIYVIGAGKASAYMALGLEEILGDRLNGGLLIVKYGHGAHLKKVKVIEAGHPIPDENGLFGARALSKTRERISQRGSCLLCYLGGGSALLPLPVAGISLKEKQDDH